MNFIDYELSVELGPDTTFCYGEPIELEVESPYELQYQWQDNSTSNSLMATEPGTYAVTVSDGCQEAIDEIYLNAESCCHLYVPNVFTPNFDGTNDELRSFSDCEFPVLVLNFSTAGELWFLNRQIRKRAGWPYSW